MAHGHAWPCIIVILYNNEIRSDNDDSSHTFTAVPGRWRYCSTYTLDSVIYIGRRMYHHVRSSRIINTIYSRTVESHLPRQRRSHHTLVCIRGTCAILPNVTAMPCPAEETPSHRHSDRGVFAGPRSCGIAAIHTVRAL